MNDVGGAAAAAAAETDTDAELERLKTRRLAEMQKNMRARMMQEKRAETLQGGDDNGDSSTAPKRQTPRDAVVSMLGFRGLEVLEQAEAQFPAEARIIVSKLAELLRSGELSEVIDGGQLLALFRMVGLPVKIATTIKVEEDGKFVSLSDKIKNKS